MSNLLLSRIVAASVQISRKAAKIIREIKISGTLDTVEKARNDYVTKADFQSQMCIIKSLENLFPKLKFCGEEGELKGDYNDLECSLNTDVLDILSKKNLDNLCPQYSDIKEDDLVVWVDPLDGTREYTLGEEFAHEVTILIGISYKGKPIAGVVNQPFYTKNINDLNGDRVIWGIRGLGAYHNGNEKKHFENINSIKNENLNKYRIVTTRSHLTDLVRRSLLNIPNSELTFCGGSGYKTLCVIDGTSDCYLYPRNGTKRWDTCAPEAILRALGGQFTDVFNNEYDYSKSDHVENDNGIIATISDHEYYLKHLSDELLNDLRK